MQPTVKIGHRLGNGHLDRDARLPDLDEPDAEPGGVSVGGEEACNPLGVDHVAARP